MIPTVTIGPHRLILGDAYAVRPGLGWMDCDCMDPPYAFNNSGGGAFRKARGASDQIVAEQLDRGFDHSVQRKIGLRGYQVTPSQNRSLRVERSGP